MFTDTGEECIARRPRHSPVRPRQRASRDRLRDSKPGCSAWNGAGLSGGWPKRGLRIPSHPDQRRSDPGPSAAEYLRPDFRRIYDRRDRKRRLQGIFSVQSILLPSQGSATRVPREGRGILVYPQTTAGPRVDTDLYDRRARATACSPAEQRDKPQSGRMSSSCTLCSCRVLVHVRYPHVTYYPANDRCVRHCKRLPVTAPARKRPDQSGQAHGCTRWSGFWGAGDALMVM